MPPCYRLNLLNGFQLLADGQPVNGIHAPRLQALLAYLALHRRTPHPRQQVAFLMWPDATEAQARTNLRKAIHTLKQTLPSAEIFLDREGALQWNPDAPCALDVAEFEAAMATGALEQAVMCYSGDLLPNCYDEWALRERERLRQCYMEALERLIRQKEENCDTIAALGFAQRLLQCEPLREEIYRHLMRLHATNGDRSAALLTYQTCATLLERELGVEPSPATRQAYERLLEPALPQKLPPLAGSLPLVGRAAEWEHLRRAWRAAAQGQPQMALIRGEAGIGKTRLAEELLAWVDRQGIATASVACYAAEGTLAYEPVKLWLRQRSLQKLERVWLAEIARLLPELVEQRPDLPACGPLAEAWQRQRFHEALARAVLGRDAADQPSLFLIEDLHWCDRDTLEWLHYLLRFNPRARLLVLGTLRTEVELSFDQPLATLLTALKRRNALTEIDLHPLSETETADLGGQTLGQALDPETSTHLYRESEGNPLLIVELARAGQMGASPDRLPPAVQSVIAARLEQLSAAAQEVMTLAAVSGRAFTFAVLEAACEKGKNWLMTALDELWRRRVIREQGRDAYDFSHDKIRQVVLENLPPRRQVTLHIRWAEALERVSPDQVEALAQHFTIGQVWQKALHYHKLAADKASALFAYPSAVQHLNQALHAAGQCESSASERFDLLRCRETILDVLGQREGQGLDLEQMALLAEADPWRLYAIKQRQAYWLKALNRFAEAETTARQALALAQQIGDNEVQTDAWITLGESVLAAFDGRLELVRDCFLAAEALCQRTHNLRQLASIHAHLALLQDSSYLSTTLEENCLQALALYQQLGDKARQADLYCDLGSLRQGQEGGHARVEEAYQNALRLAREIGYRLVEGRVLNNLGNIYADMQVERALSCFDESAAIFWAMGDERRAHVVCLNIAQCRLTAYGDHETTSPLAEAALEYASQAQDHWLWGFAEIILGLAAWRNQEMDAACQRLAQAITRLESTTGSWLVGVAYQSLAQVEVELGKCTAAWEHLRLAESLARERQWAPSLVMIQTAQAAICLREGRLGEAEALSAQAMQGWTPTGSQPWLAAFVRSQALAAVGKATEAMPLLEQARGLLMQMLDGLTPEHRVMGLQRVPEYQEILTA